ncbi:exopolygalacturonase-like [Dorcoceras hygrometricum]|uniref:Exopolygalacturonase-like n=1 Tax=Dorcoceras hygrometricum TaxID=472368 RepID=A0A2Z7ACD5_9LAMI|nr:exopolygalacturonase-like [Dorcoceras hygrometricum]
MAAILLFLLPAISVVNGYSGPSYKRLFDVMRYRRNGGAPIDITQATLQAWRDACRHEGGGRVRIPPGRYRIDSVRFIGPCRGPMEFLIEGTLIAPTDPSKFFTDTWIGFRYIDDLTVNGRGVLDGKGAAAWPYNDCWRNPNCRFLPVTLRFDFVTNSRVRNLSSFNSKNAHIYIFACHNLNISRIALIAPGNSPNTDGIHIGSSTKIQISHANIHTGDDCVSMVAGSQDIDIFDVVCGPGHGISIGSLGRTHETEYVTGVHVNNCTFIGADNGLRIKTWAPSLYSLASDIRFENIIMKNTANPIIIDQQYCPSGNCKVQGMLSSEVQIKDVTFRNIKGTSNTKVAVNMQCSPSLPCKNIHLIDIDLSYRGRGGRTTSSCSHVTGSSWGKQKPNGCI